MEKGELNCGDWKREAKGVEGGGEPSTTPAACTSIYVERPPTVGKEFGAKKQKKQTNKTKNPQQLRVVYFAASTLWVRLL